MKNSLNEPDVYKLEEIINTLRSKHSRIQNLVQDRLTTIQTTMTTQKETVKQVAAGVAYLTEIQEEIQKLNKPIGWTVEDAQSMLDSYQVRPYRLL